MIASAYSYAMTASDTRVWIAIGRTYMRKGMQRLALLVQQGLGRDPHGGDLGSALARHTHVTLCCCGNSVLSPSGFIDSDPATAMTSQRRRSRGGMRGSRTCSRFLST